MKGRKPKPTKLKVLQGTNRKDRSNPKEPTPKTMIPPMPGWLDETAQEAWQELSHLLHGMKVLTEADRLALSLLCDTYSQFRDARKILKEEGNEVITEGPNGQVYKTRAEVNIVADAAKRLRSLLTEFGLTPSSRTRLQVKGEEEVDPFEGFLAKAKGTSA